MINISTRKYKINMGNCQCKQEIKIFLNGEYVDRIDGKPYLVHKQSTKTKLTMIVKPDDFKKK